LNQNIWELKGRSLHGQRRRAEVTLMLLNLKFNDIVLDVGCGEGFATSFLANSARFVVGLPFKSSIFTKVTLLEVLEHLMKPELCIKEVERCSSDDSVVVVSVPWREKITYTRCIHCGKLTPLWGHLHSFDLKDIISLFPKSYKLKRKIHLPNTPFISLSRIFSLLSTKVWLLLNNFLGRRKRKGYWIILKLKKNSDLENS